VTEKKTVETLGLVDSGAGGKFIDQNYAKKEGFKLHALETPIQAYNVDGTKNKRGTIKAYVKLDMEINGRKQRTQLLVTGLGKERIILGFPWLNEQNPEINWRTGKFSWRKEKRFFFNDKNLRGQELAKKLSRRATRTPVTITEEEDIEAHLNSTQNPLKDDELSLLIATITGDTDNEIWINSKSTTATQIQADINSKRKVLPLEEQIPKEFHEFLDVFSEEKAARFPEPRSWDHKIELKEGFVPKSFKTYNLTPQEQIELDKFLKENTEKGYIRPSQSPMASPFFFVDKKDGKLRPCQDYRYLNEHTIKNAYPLPRITELLDKLKGAKYFTKLDVRWGYNNVRIRDGDQWKAAFKTNRGLFEPTVMFFGLCNSPATFQAMMDDIFGDMINDCIIIVYMDDIFLFAKDIPTLTKNTKEVLRRLRDNDLFLKPTKCEFNQTKVEYLGMVIEEGKISMDPGKLAGIKDWPAPTTVKETRKFLGFGNFYRRFIRKFSQLAKPMNDLLKKDQQFSWTDACQRAFNTLKKKFTEEPVLMMPDQTRPFQIETDASKYATGAVLTQLDSNGDRHPVSFISKTLSPAERNYEIYDRELLAIIRALEEWRHYIQGSPHTTIVLSDHKNLTYYREAKKLTRRQARWSLYLSEFDIKLIHTPGNKMVQSDALSRRPDLCPDEDTDNEDIVMLPDNLFLNLIDTALQDKIALCNDLDQEAVDALKILLNDTLNVPTPLKKDLEDWTIENSNGRRLLFYKGKNYIPRNIDLRREILSNFHDHETAGHPGELGTFNAVRQHYWWPGLRTFVKNYVQGCGSCQQFKIDRSPAKPAYLPTEGSILSDLLRIAQWTLSLTFHRWTDSILFWSW
jgi:hypothetical protein